MTEQLIGHLPQGRSGRGPSETCRRLGKMSAFIGKADNVVLAPSSSQFDPICHFGP
jgi:hypothetical protein